MRQPTNPDATGCDCVDHVTALASFTVPWGGQQVELHEIGFDAGGSRLLRIRIREGRRFTIFDIDPFTAQAWGLAMADWAARQLAQSQTAAGLGGESG